ncbi:MAG: hypothetical protein K0Q59_3247 [Paenibacillus sp.]|nr:hypothetical protein [Paenibacillus sp.]
MKMVSAIAAVAICAALFEIPSLWRKRLWKELWTFSALLAFGTALSVARALHMPILNPTDWLIFAFKPVSGFIVGLFK